MRHIGLRQLYPIILSKCIVLVIEKRLDSCLDPMVLRLPLILIMPILIPMSATPEMASRQEYHGSYFSRDMY